MGNSSARNKEWNWQDTGQKIAMGEKVGAILTQLRETACVHVEERESIGIIKMFIQLFSDVDDSEAQELLTFMQERMIPALIELGYGRWYRDVITDLALALAGKGKDDRTKVKVDGKKLLS